MLVLRTGQSADNKVKIRCRKARPTIRLNHRGLIISTRSAICKPGVAATALCPREKRWADKSASTERGGYRSILAEGVGFEPTVGCPTLDFESSALNRTQPPFLFAALI